MLLKCKLRTNNFGLAVFKQIGPLFAYLLPTVDRKQLSGGVARMEVLSLCLGAFSSF